MALKAIANKEEFDSFGSDIQSHYSADVADAGVFRLSVTPHNGIELADVAGLKGALHKERSQVSTLKTSLNSFDGFTAEEARTAITELEALKKDGGGNKTRDEVRAELDSVFTTKFNADKDALTKKFTSDLDTRDNKINTLSTQLERRIIDGEAMEAITKAGGSIKLLIGIVRAASKVIESESGAKMSRIIGSDGLERMSPKAGSSDPMTISEFVAELRDNKDYAGAFNASGQSGSGATGSGGDIETSNAFVLSEVDKLNPVKYQALKERAKKAGKQVLIQE